MLLYGFIKVTLTVDCRVRKHLSVKCVQCPCLGCKCGYSLSGINGLYSQMWPSSWMMGSVAELASSPFLCSQEPAAN